MDSEDGRHEYVLNETGRIYVGTPKKLKGRPWNFGQVGEVPLLRANVQSSNNGSRLCFVRESSSQLIQQANSIRCRAVNSVEVRGGGIFLDKPVVFAAGKFVTDLVSVRGRESAGGAARPREQLSRQTGAREPDPHLQGPVRHGECSPGLPRKQGSFWVTVHAALPLHLFLLHGTTTCKTNGTKLCE